MVNEGILALIRSHEELAWLGTCQSDDQINQAEGTLDVVFPEQYRAYLRKFGSLSFGPHEYTGLGIDTLNVVSVTERARKRSQLPCHFVVLAEHDGDELVCMDCSVGASNGRVVIWDLPTRTVSRQRADDFFDFLSTDIAGFVE